MIEKHLQNQIQRCSAKQDNESVITPEHCTIERYFEKNSLHECLQKKKCLENTLVPTLMTLMNRMNKLRMPCTLALADSRKYVSFTLF